MAELAEKFHLNSEEQNYLLTAMPGEGLLFAMNDHIPLKVVPSPQELELITTNPDEVRKREEKLAELGTVKENLEPYKIEKNYYAMKELNKDQIEFLKEKGFVEARLCGLETYSQWFLVKKPNSNESVEHYFMVQSIAEEIRKYTENVSTYSSLGPDITFQIQKNEDQIEWYAIEVETGSQLTHAGDLDLKVYKNNESERPKYKEWWFIMTDKTRKANYEKLHKTLTRTELKEKILELLDIKTAKV